MRHSDIFDSYAKIAEEQGLVSLSEDEVKTESDKPRESAKLRKYKKSPAPRAGSDTIETIEALYHVKPNNSIEYENNIMEAAHKTPVVIAPSYDRINALVENNIERNNIMCNIVMKQNDSNSTYHRYAKQELLMQLVRVANDLDNSGNEELRVLADACIEALALKKNADFWDDIKEKGKEWFGVGEGAAAGAALGGVAGGIIGAFFGSPLLGARLGAWIGGGTSGLIASLAKTAPHVVNISANAKDTISQIDDLKSKIPNTNKEYNFLVAFEGQLKSLATASEQYNELLSSMHSNASSPQDAEKAHQVTDALNTAKNTVKQYADKFNDNVKIGIYNEYDTHSKILDPVYSLIDTDIEDIQRSIQSLMTAISKFDEAIGTVKQTAAPAVAQAEKGPTPTDEKSEEDYAGLLNKLDVPSDKKEQAEGFFESLLK